MILDIAAIGMGKSPTRDGELVLLDLVADARAPRPCGRIRPIRRFIDGRLIVAEAKAVHIDILRRRHTVAVRIGDILKVAARAPLLLDGRVRIDAVLHKADAARVVHERDQPLFIGARRK